MACIQCTCVRVFCNTGVRSGIEIELLDTLLELKHILIPFINLGVQIFEFLLIWHSIPIPVCYVLAVFAASRDNLV